MKFCPKCNLKIGGSTDYCPLCQNELTGEPDENYFPPVYELRKKSMCYKIQLMATLSAIVIAVLLDYCLDLHGALHWSSLVVLLGIISQLVTRILIKRNAGLISFITYIAMGLFVFIIIGARLVGLSDFCAGYVIPSMFMAVLGAQFLLAFLDRLGNVMVYFICTLLISMCFVGFMSVHSCSFMLLWKICGGLDLILLLGVIIFRGGRLWIEIQKRTNL
jgi:hypothetical protein